MHIFLKRLYLSLLVFTFIMVSLFLSSSSLMGISFSSSIFVSSYLYWIFVNLIASKHFLRSLSVLVPSILSTSRDFFSKSLFFLDFSHQSFHALNFRREFSDLLSRQAYFRPKNTLCLNHRLVMRSLILSYLSSSPFFFVKPNQLRNPYL